MIWTSASKVSVAGLGSVSPHQGHVSPVSRYTCCGSRPLLAIPRVMFTRKKRCRLFFLFLHLAITALTSASALRDVMLYRKGRPGCPCCLLGVLMMSLSYGVLGYRTKGVAASSIIPECFLRVCGGSAVMGEPLPILRRRDESWCVVAEDYDRHYELSQGEGESEGGLRNLCSCNVMLFFCYSASDSA